MAVISKTLTTSAESHLRFFDARRDLEAVADLIELCFEETLDPDGRNYLGRMRSAAKSDTWWGWMSSAEWSNPALTGYVWQEDGRTVGNVSLVPYFVRGQRFYLIANVAVHPDYRRRGIARAMTEQAIQYSRQHKSPSVWLHVREENLAAVQLYESLDFAERARRTTWFSTPDFATGGEPTGARFIPPNGRHWKQERAWLLKNYPPELSWHMPLKLNMLDPGLFGDFYRFLYNSYIHQWALVRGNRLLGAIAWQPTSSHANALWLALSAESDERIAYALLTYARQNAPSPRPLMLDYPARQHDRAIQAAGFYSHQTLIWMELPFYHRP
jgi:ribosomal protein S18 acetylase RimI-like enzyme